VTGGGRSIDLLIWSVDRDREEAAAASETYGLIATSPHRRTDGATSGDRPRVLAALTVAAVSRRVGRPVEFLSLAPLTSSSRNPAMHRGVKDFRAAFRNVTSSCRRRVPV